MTMNSDVFSIGIRPEVTILSVLRHLNYKPWFALAEFIDNSLQSYLTNQEALNEIHGQNYVLKVSIRIDPEGFGRIVISDNAAGIAGQDFPRAFRPAQLPPDREGLSEFGMGMKSAACWFAKKWSVRTKALDEPLERTIKFDIDQILKNNTEELAIINSPSDPIRHYTEIELTDLCHIPQNRTIGKIKEHLSSIYRVFLREGCLELEFNGEKLEGDEVAVLKAPYYKDPMSSPIVWSKPIDMDLGSGYRVTGFAALRDIGSTTHAGFALFRRNRLIEGSADETYRPEEIFKKTNSFIFQRLFGELHLSGFEVSHTKDGFRWEEHEELFLELLNEELTKEPLNLIDQAEGHRAKSHRKSLDDAAKKATDRVAKLIETELVNVLEEEASNPGNPEKIPENIKRQSISGFERIVEVQLQATTWILSIKASTDSSIGDWLRIGDACSEDLAGTKRKTIQVDVSLVHPFVERFSGTNNENIETFIRLASASALAVALSTESGVQSHYYIYFFNKLLRETFSHP